MSEQPNENSIYYSFYASPVGLLKLIANQDTLLSIEYNNSKDTFVLPNRSNEILLLTKNQLDCYFLDPLHKFDIPLNITGSDFQICVYKELLLLSPGISITYGDLAKILETSARAVGNALRRNPIPIIIGCHRVVGKSSYGGYSGKTQGHMLEKKLKLLDHENIKLL